MVIDTIIITVPPTIAALSAAWISWKNGIKAEEKLNKALAHVALLEQLLRDKK